MSHVTPQMQAIYDEFRKVEPEVELSGIYADKPGYHNTRAGNLSSNYSVAEFAVDRQGPSDKAAAIDLTFPSAQRGDYSKISKYANRLYAAGRADDPRTHYLREFFGQMDTDSHVEGYDFAKERDSTSDSSHLWHIHLSVHRAYVEDPEMVRAVLSILKGETVEQWRAGGGVIVVPVGNPTSSTDNTEVIVGKLPVLKKGATGAPVRILEGLVIAHGYATDSKDPKKVDGIFGDTLDASIRRFQADRHIDVDGVVGGQTYAQLLNV